MLKIRKNLVALFVAAIAVSSVMAGCGRKEDTAAPTTVEQEIQNNAEGGDGGSAVGQQEDNSQDNAALAPGAAGNTASDTQSDVMTEYQAFSDNTVNADDLYLDFGDYTIDLRNVRLSDFADNGWTLDAVTVNGFRLVKEGFSRGMYVYMPEMKTPSPDSSGEEIFSENLNGEITKINFEVPTKAPVSLFGITAVDDAFGDPTPDAEAARILMKLCLRGFGDGGGRTLEQMEENENCHSNMHTEFIVGGRYYYVEYAAGCFNLLFADVTETANHKGREWGEWYETGYYERYKDEAGAW